MGEFFGVLIIIGILVSMMVYVAKFLGNGGIRHYSEIPGVKDIVMLFDKNTPNPWESKITSSPHYGKIPPNISELMKRVSADPDEKVISSIWVMNGLLSMGYLVLTTSYIRWIKVFPTQSEDKFWLHNSRVFKEDMQTLSVEDHLFLLRSLPTWVPFNNHANNFALLHGIIQQALMHEDRAVPAAHEANQEASLNDGSLASELKKLASLRDEKVLSEAEFIAAKKKLLQKK